MDARVERSRSLVRQAAIAQLAESGWSGFTIDAIARRAGVARTTVYRHWPDRRAILLDALEAASDRPPIHEDEPDGRAQVVALVQHLAEVMADPRRSAVTPALIDAAERDPMISEVHRGFNDSRIEALVRALERQGVPKPDMVATALAGAVVYARVMSRQPLLPTQAAELVEAVLGSAPSDPSHTGR